MTDDLPSPHPDAHAVLDFWFGDSLAHGWPVVPRKPLWFGNDPATDSTIRERFGALVAQAVAGGLHAWEASPPDRLALLVLLDQFTRNLYRGRAEAFAGDARACALARDALDRGLDRQLPPIGRVFVLMPLMHAEDLALQDRAVELFRGLHKQAAVDERSLFAGFLDFAERHRRVIARFGRFPHRNLILGRVSSDEEQAFLREPGSRF